MPTQATGDLMSGTALVARIGDQALAGPLGSLDAYLERVSRIAVLSREEERALAERFRSRGDLAAARQLVLSHLRFVVHIARGYSGYGLPVGDLIQEGNVGLMKAVKRFDPSLNVRLVWLAVRDLSFDPAPDAADEELYSPAAYLPAPDADPAGQVEDAESADDSTDRLHGALRRLDERSRDIVQQRWMSEDKATLHQLADKYGVSAERIRQIESSALGKLRALVAA